MQINAKRIQAIGAQAALQATALNRKNDPVLKTKGCELT